MIRLPLGSIVSVLALVLAAAFVAPSVVAPEGEPMLVAAGEPAALQPASFEGPPCASTLLLEGAVPGAAPQGLRVVAVDLRPSARGMSLELREVPSGGLIGEAVLLLFVDSAGQVVAAQDPVSIEGSLASDGCPAIAPVHKPAGAV